MEAAIITKLIIPAVSLSKFIRVSFDENGFIFKAIKNVEDRVPIPSRGTSSGDIFRIESSGNGVWVGPVLR